MGIGLLLWFCEGEDEGRGRVGVRICGRRRLAATHSPGHAYRYIHRHRDTITPARCCPSPCASASASRHPVEPHLALGRPGQRQCFRPAVPADPPLVPQGHRGAQPVLQRRGGRVPVARRGQGQGAGGRGGAGASPGRRRAGGEGGQPEHRLGHLLVGHRRYAGERPGLAGGAFARPTARLGWKRRRACGCCATSSCRRATRTTRRGRGPR